MSEKVQLDHVLLDVDFLDKPKIVALMTRYGHVSALFLIQVMATLSKATNAEMDVYAAYGLACKFSISIEDAKAIVAHCVKEGILNLQNEILSNTRVTADQEKLAAARKRKADNQKAYRERVNSNPGDGHVTITEMVTPVTATVTDTVTDTEQYKEIVSRSDVHSESETPPNLDDANRDLWGLSMRCFAPIVGNEPFLKTNAYIQNARRPLKVWPRLWLSQRQVFEIMQEYDSRGLEKSEWERCFNRAQADVGTAMDKGQKPETSKCYQWLIGYILEEALGIKKQELINKKIQARA